MTHTPAPLYDRLMERGIDCDGEQIITDDLLVEAAQTIEELLAALRDFLAIKCVYDTHPVSVAARAAIAKATGEKL